MAPDFSRVELLLRLHRLPEAEQAAHAVLAQDPNNARALGWLGVCQLRQHQSRVAIQTLHRAIAADPISPILYAWLAEAYIAAKDLFAAQAAIKQALRLAPGQAAFHGLSGIVLLRQLRPRQALRAARTGLALDPSDTQCLTIQARALAVLGKAPAGIALFAPALAADPTDAIAQANQGFNHFDDGNFRAAQTHFLVALQQQPGNEQVRKGLLEALKSSFWFYRVILLMVRLGFRLVHATGFFRIDADIRKIILYTLQIPLLFFTWGWAFQYGFFSKVSYFVIGLRLLLLTPLGLIIGMVILSVFLHVFMLTLLRFNPLARPYLSAREILASNCFLAGVGVALLGVGLHFSGFFN
jgi:tetratricopeptide (TPR) repeat protein